MISAELAESITKNKSRDAADSGVTFNLIRHRPNAGTHEPILRIHSLQRNASSCSMKPEKKI